MYKNLILLLFLILGVASCSSNMEEESNLTASVSEEQIQNLCINYASSVNSVADQLAKDTLMLNGYYKYEEEILTRGANIEDSKLVDSAKPLTSNLLENSEKLLIAFNIKDVSSLNDSEKIELALLLYADYMEQGQVTTRGGNITGNHYVDCALSALGISEISNVAKNGLLKYAQKAGGKALLKLTAKFAGKTVPYVGWALMAYDFYTCV